MEEIVMQTGYSPCNKRVSRVETKPCEGDNNEE